jgi:hypothetical protein
MNVFYIPPIVPGIELPVDRAFTDLNNLRRIVQVDDPEDVFGEPIYVGPLWGAKALPPGTYHYVYTDEEEWDI